MNKAMLPPQVFTVGYVGCLNTPYVIKTRYGRGHFAPLSASLPFGQVWVSDARLRLAYRERGDL
jgi:hypothetical protein